MWNPAAKTILVVDDYEPHNYALARSLQTAGFNVLTASTGTDALKRAAVHPDVIVLDVGLPDVNGIEVCRRIKSNPDTASIPVVFVSASHQSQHVMESAQAAGASSFLFFPVEVEYLVMVIRGSLAKAANADLSGGSTPVVN